MADIGKFFIDPIQASDPIKFLYLLEAFEKPLNFDGALVFVANNKIIDASQINSYENQETGTWTYSGEFTLDSTVLEGKEIPLEVEFKGATLSAVTFIPKRVPPRSDFGKFMAAPDGTRKIVQFWFTISDEELTRAGVSNLEEVEFTVRDEIGAVFFNDNKELVDIPILLNYVDDAEGYVVYSGQFSFPEFGLTAANVRSLISTSGGKIQLQARLGSSIIKSYPLTIPASQSPLEQGLLTTLPRIESDIRRLAAQDRVQRIELKEPGNKPTDDQALWDAIRKTKIDFEAYAEFIEKMFDPECGENKSSRDSRAKNQIKNHVSPFQNVASYQFLKQSTDYFLLTKSFFFDDTDARSSTIFLGSNFMGKSAKPSLKKLYRDEFFLDSIARAVESNFPLDVDFEPGLPGQNKQDDRANFKPALYPKGEDLDCLIGGQQDLPDFSWYASAQPMLELIWSYWMEEAGLVQTMNAISLRFQNVKRRQGADPLANLALDSLRPLSNLMWGFIEDERDRTSIVRRCYEYDSQYGISLRGRAIPTLSSVESRSKFLGAFHHLLKMAYDYYQQSNFLTVKPDAFPLLNQLREVHVILREGQHNQFRDLTWSSRVEMLTQQWILNREEVKEFIRGRFLVPYEEGWMGSVDTMKRLQNWTDTSVTHFFNLATNGEQLLLSVRYGDWASPDITSDNAANWAQFWRNEIQRYIHAYRAVTGVDMAADMVETRPAPTVEADRYLPPAHHLERREMYQRDRQEDFQGQMSPPPVFSRNSRR